MIHPDEIMVPLSGDLQTPPLPTSTTTFSLPAAAAVSTPTTSYSAASASSYSWSRDEEALFPLMYMEFPVPENMFQMGLDDMVPSWDDSLAQPPLSPSLQVLSASRPPPPVEASSCCRPSYREVKRLRMDK